jgi:hypothetical protein
LAISKGSISRVLLFVALPALVLGLFDPLEGGMGLLIAVMVAETSQAEGLPFYLMVMIAIYELGAVITLIAGIHTAYRSVKPKAV